MAEPTYELQRYWSFIQIAVVEGGGWSFPDRPHYIVGMPIVGGGWETHAYVDLEEAIHHARRFLQAIMKETQDASCQGREQANA